MRSLAWGSVVTIRAGVRAAAQYHEASWCVTLCTAVSDTAQVVPSPVVLRVMLCRLSSMCASYYV